MELKKLNRKRGSELAETILITAISVVLVVILFYPQMNTIFKKAIDSISTWFDDAISTIGVVK